MKQVFEFTDHWMFRMVVRCSYIFELDDLEEEFRQYGDTDTPLMRFIFAEIEKSRQILRDGGNGPCTDCGGEYYDEDLTKDENGKFCEDCWCERHPEDAL